VGRTDGMFSGDGRRSAWGGGRGGGGGGRGGGRGARAAAAAPAAAAAHGHLPRVAVLPAPPPLPPGPRQPLVSTLAPTAPGPLALQALRVLQHLLDEGRHGAWDLHLQCDHSLRSCRWTDGETDRRRERESSTLLFIVLVSMRFHNPPFFYSDTLRRWFSPGLASGPTGDIISQ